MKRREFIRDLVAATAMGSVSGHALARTETAGPEAVLKLGSQERRIPGKTLREKVLRLEEWGGVGLEIGGTPADRVAEIKDAVQGTAVKVSALCWGSCKGDLVAPESERRNEGIEALKRALQVAGELGSTGVIFVPCFNRQSELTTKELDAVLLDILPGIGEYAHRRGTRVLLEPLNKGETFYLNRLEQAVAICKSVDHPGICLMGDLYHMAKEEKNDDEAFVAARGRLHHVHLASRSRVLPGQDERSFVEGFRGLKRIGYRDHCSLECGIKKGTDPMVEIPKSFRFLEQQWREADI